MTCAYVVTAREFNRELLERLLPRNMVKEIQFVVSSYSGAAGSRASSILSQKQQPTVLILDAYTTNKELIDELDGLILPRLRRTAAYVPFGLFFAIPTTEIVFFQDQPLLEHLLNRKFTDLEWHLAQFSPKEALTKVLQNGANGGLTIEGLLNQLTDDMIGILRKHSFIQQLMDFLSSAEKC